MKGETDSVVAVEVVHTLRDFDCCAYQSKSGKTTCGALRYYHERIVKTHKFVEPLRTLTEQEIISTLTRENAALREAEHALSDAYLRLRSKIGMAAFNTPNAPTPEQVWEQTEVALDLLIGGYKTEVQCLRAALAAQQEKGEGNQ